MLKLKKIRIRYLFNIIFLLNIIILSFTITFIFIHSINDLGKFSMKENSDNIKRQIATLLLHDVKLKGSYYSFLFENASNISELISGQFKNIIEKSKNTELSVEDYSKVKLKKSKEGIWYNNFQFNNKAFVILDPSLAKPDIVHKKDLYILNHIQNLAGTIKKYSEYITDIWIITKNNTSCIYPNIYDTEALKKWEYSLSSIESYRKQISKNKKIGLSTTIWTKLHENALGQLQMSIVSPIYDGDNERIGLVGVSLSLHSILTEIFGDMKEKKTVGKESRKNKLDYDLFSGVFTFIVDLQGDLIAYPNQMESLFSIKKNILNNAQKGVLNLGESSNPNVEKLAYTMIKDLDGIYPITLGDKEYIIAFSTLSHSAWTLGVVIPEYDIMSSIRDTQKIIVNTKRNILISVISITLIMLFLFTVINYFFFKRFLLTPFLNLSVHARKIGKGNFNLNIEDNNILEISTISLTLNALGNELNNYMKNLKSEIKNRQSIETEVKIAADLQESILPIISKDFIRDEFTIFAKIYESSKITGDFYDFFYTDEDKNKLVLVFADVSGRGIPAAFYMAVVRTLIRSASHLKSDSPGAALSETNKILCKDVKSNMFASALVIYYDLITGVVSYANAAHREAFFVKSTESKNQQLVGVYGKVLGKSLEYDYETEVIDIEEGGKLILCTNSLIRSMLKNKEIYIDGLNDFSECLAENNKLSCMDIAELIDKKILNHQFVNETGGVSLMIFEKFINTKKLD